MNLLNRQVGSAQTRQAARNQQGHFDVHGESWLALMVGNSRWHWGQFLGYTLQHQWDVPESIGFTSMPAAFNGTVVAASVVPNAVDLLSSSVRLAYPVRSLTLDDVPLQNMYPTLGIDRALGVYGAGITYGFPTIAIDAGTALTITVANGDRELSGGAIMPGFGLQLRMLSEQTAGLPPVTVPSGALPERFARGTADAIRSGVGYTLGAGIREFVSSWRSVYPNTSVVLTGGDSVALWRHLNLIAPDLAGGMECDPNVVFWGMRAVMERQ
ncbi:MAG: pantothenate kinase [Cyanophyceae cyanobacterium]